MIKTTPAPEPKLKKLHIVSYIYATILIALTLRQLVAFDEFVVYLATYLEPWSVDSTIVGITLVALEVFSMPFLLRLRLSWLARALSGLCVLATPLAWATVTMMSETFTWGHILLNIAFLSAGGFSYWVLGGPQTLRRRVQ